MYIDYFFHTSTSLSRVYAINITTSEIEIINGVGNGFKKKGANCPQYLFLNEFG